MRVFSAPLGEFQRKVLTNDLYAEMVRDFPRVAGYSSSPSETRSWRGSLPRLEGALRLAELPPDVHVTLEEPIPYYSKRMDACLFGHSKDGQPYSVIVELKGWEDAKALEDGNVQTFLGGALRDEPHPSAQVRGYHEHLEDFRHVYQVPDRVGLASCAYCHNYPGIIPDEGLFHPQFDTLRTVSPTFGERDAPLLARFLKCRLSQGRGGGVLNDYDSRGIGPSRQLIEHATEMIREQNVFRLLDEQLAANSAIVSAVSRASRRKKRQVILVNGGPGTGKSVIALNALGEVLRREASVSLVTGSAAFTYGMRRILGKRLDGLIRFTDYFWDKPDSTDVLIIDEAHRIRTRSQPKVMKHLRPRISQIEELMRAARVTVFFVDENQIISPAETGEPGLIREAATRAGAVLHEFTLTAQFRCNGSSAYITWLDDVLGLTSPSQGLRLAVPSGFNFRVTDTPGDLWSEVREKNDRTANSARLLAGWCWPWSDPLPDGLVGDIRIGDFHFPWEAKNGKKPPPGIPEAKYWAVDPAGVTQAGTVYSVQGFETGHVGVIIGPDLVNRNGEWMARPGENFSNSLRRQAPEVALPYVKRIYRTLLSRGMRSCTLYSTDHETRDFFRARLMPG